MEAKVIFFVVTIFFAGVLLSYFNSGKSKLNTDYDYSVQDSLFQNSAEITKKSEAESKLTQKKVESKQELSDFSTNNINRKDNFVLININKAGLDELSKLPGIGAKTAARIIEFRNINGNFMKVDDLIKVKGIGKSKLMLISKLIKIEN